MKAKRIMISLALILAAAILGTTVPAYGKCKDKANKEEVRIAKELHYRDDGKFKILQFADTHYIAGDPRSERSL